MDKNTWRQLHQVHLESDYWRQVKNAVEVRDHGRCVRCGATAADGPLDVHHKHYKNWRDELRHLGCVELLCRCCHDLQHNRIPTHRVMSDADLDEQVKRFRP